MKRLSVIPLLLAVVACQPCPPDTCAGCYATLAPLSTRVCEMEQLGATAVAVMTEAAPTATPEGMPSGTPDASAMWLEYIWLELRHLTGAARNAERLTWETRRSLLTPTPTGTYVPPPTPTATLPPMLCAPCTDDRMCGAGLYCCRTCVGREIPICVRLYQPSTDCRECP